MSSMRSQIEDARGRCLQILKLRFQSPSSVPFRVFNVPGTHLDPLGQTVRDLFPEIIYDSRPSQLILINWSPMFA